MNRRYTVPQVTLRLSILFLVMTCLAISCSKKNDEPTGSANTPTTVAAPTAAQPADPAAQAPAPGLDSSQLIGDPKAAMAEADAALRQKEYEKTAKLLMAIQGAQMSQQQALLARQQMVSFQRTLAGAVASGDPNAKAAADALRAGHSR